MNPEQRTVDSGKLEGDNIAPDHVILARRISVVNTDIALHLDEATKTGRPRYDKKFYSLTERKGELIGQALMLNRTLPTPFIVGTTILHPLEVLWSGSQPLVTFRIKGDSPNWFNTKSKLHEIRVADQISSSQEAQNLIGNIIRGESNTKFFLRTINELESDDAKRYPDEVFQVLIRLLKLRRIPSVPRMRVRTNYLIGQTKLRETRHGLKRKQNKSDQLSLTLALPHQNIHKITIDVPTFDQEAQKAAGRELRELLVLDDWGHRH